MKSLERRLGLSHVVAISIGAMLGSGLFVLPGLAAAMTGRSVWLAYIVAGLGVLPAALSKAELATAMPVSGGTYVYIDRTFGPMAGTIAGVGLWLSLLLKSSFALVGFGAYLAALDQTFSLKVAATALLVVVLSLNMVGIRKVGSVQLSVVIVAIISLAFLAFIGGAEVDFSRAALVMDGGFSGFFACVAFVYISYAGVTKIAAVAEEVKDPAKTLPLGILLSLILVTILYGSVTFVLVGNVSPAELQGDYRPIYSLALRVGGTGMATAAALLGVMTMTSMANAGVLAASRFPFAMSRDRLLPSFLARVGARFMTPWVAILATGAVMGAAIWFLDVAKIAKIASSTMILAFMAVNLTVVVLRETHAQWYKPAYKTPLYPWTQVAGIIVGAVLLVMLGWPGVIGVTAAVVTGLVVYWSYGRARAERLGVVGRLGPRKSLVRQRVSRAESLDSVLPGEAAVVVPLFGREKSPEALAEVGVALAKGRKVEVVHLTDVPEQIGLDTVLEEDVAVSSLRRRLSAMAEEKEVDIEFDPTVTRDVARSVYEVSNRVHCDWVVMDWQARARRGIRPYNPLGWLISHLPSNVAAFKDVGIRRVREIVALPQPGPHDALVVTTADHLASMWGARLTLARFVHETAPSSRLAEEEDYLRSLFELCRSEPSSILVRGRDEIASLAARTGAYDLMVQGAPNQSKFFSFLFGTPADRLTRLAACSVLRVGTPHHRTHEAVERRAEGHRDTTVSIEDHLEPAAVAVAMGAKRKEALFAQMARTLDEVLPTASAVEIEERLWERERAQNTAVGHGVAMPHAVVRSAARTHLGLFVLDKPIDYGAPDGTPVDIVFVTVGPQSERTIHLKLLAGVSRLVRSEAFRERLRRATTVEDALGAMIEDPEPSMGTVSKEPASAQV